MEIAPNVIAARDRGGGGQMLVGVHGDVPPLCPLMAKR